MKMKYLLPFPLLLLCGMLFGQAPTVEWATTFGGSATDGSNGVTIDSAGNIISVGRFSATVDFDPGPGDSIVTSLGGNDAVIQKLTPEGEFIWAAVLGGTGSITAYDVTVDLSGNIYVIGGFWSTIDLDPGPGIDNSTANGSQDVFIIKLDANGTYLWGNTFGGTAYEDWSTVQVDDLGNVYVGGKFEETVDFDPGPGINNKTSAGSSDAFVLKLTTDGEFDWFVQFGGSSWEWLYTIALDPNDNIFASGMFAGTVDFDPGPGVTNLTSVMGLEDSYVLKLDPDGNFEWAIGIGGPAIDESWTVAADDFGNVFLGGHFIDSLDLDPGPGVDMIVSQAGYDGLIAKYDSSGNYLWGKTFGGAGTCFLNALHTDDIGNVYATSQFSGTLDLDPGPDTLSATSAGANDLLVQKFDISGNLDWAIHTGGPDSDVGRGISVKQEDVLAVCGNFRDTTDLNPGPDSLLFPSMGVADAFVMMLSPCVPTSAMMIETACDSLLAPSGTHVYYSSGMYMDTLVNASGCDSIVEIDLTLSPIDTSLMDLGDSLRSNDTLGAYQWVKCDSGFASISGATEQVFAPIENGMYAVIIDRGGCVDTSVCYPVIINERALHLDLATLQVFPNPTKGTFRVTGTKAIAEISIFDALGRETIVSVSQSKEVKVNIEGPAGVYSLRVKDIAGQVFTSKVIKL